MPRASSRTEILRQPCAAVSSVWFGTLAKFDSTMGATKTYHRIGRTLVIPSELIAAQIGPLLCKDLCGMINIRRLTTATLGCTALFVVAGCKSIPGSEEPSPPPRVYSPRPASPEEEITLIHADSEVFAAVVRAQLRAGTDEYPLHIDELRYDPRPYGTRSGYPEWSAGVEGAAPELYFARAGQSAIDQIAENRKQILQMRKVPEGSPFNYPQCAGVRVPKPPPSRRGSTARPKVADVHAGCPKKPESYVTVGLPLRGQPEGLKKIRDSRGELVDLNGDVWTTLVDEYLAGPSGWSHTQHAWVFKRSRWTGRLELAATIQTGIVE